MSRLSERVDILSEALKNHVAIDIQALIKMSNAVFAVQNRVSELEHQVSELKESIRDLRDLVHSIADEVVKNRDRSCDASNKVRALMDWLDAEYVEAESQGKIVKKGTAK